VVVETVDYQQWEVGNFPPPTNPTEVGARVLIQRRAETAPAPSSAAKAKGEKEKEEGEKPRSGANLQVLFDRKF
jgi:splicing factor 3A subunit 1